MKNGFLCQDGRASGFSARSVTTAGVLTAMAIVATMFTKIPTPLPQGYFNLGDAVVLTAAALFGSRTGAFVGGIGSMLADIFLGGYIFAPITLVVKGLEGFVAGLASGGGAAGRRGRLAASGSRGADRGRGKGGEPSGGAPDGSARIEGVPNGGAPDGSARIGGVPNRSALDSGVQSGDAPNGGALDSSAQIEGALNGGASALGAQDDGVPGGDSARASGVGAKAGADGEPSGNVPGGDLARAASAGGGHGPSGGAPRGLFGALGGSKTLFICLGAATMVAGYFVAEATVLRLFDSGAFGWAAAVTELPINLIQGCVSAILARIIAASLKAAKLVP
jgi:uncharacterized membrane protein